jgi:predicted phosphoribosyltransferase
VILVDYAITTGSTILAAARWIKEESKYKYKKLIVTVLVAPAKGYTIYKLNQIADKVIVLYMPEEFFMLLVNFINNLIRFLMRIQNQ